MVIEELIKQLARATIGATFNFYRDGDGAAARTERLRAYLEARAGAPILLVGEAAGYRGARVSGIPFTSERQLTGRGPAEASATIVHRVLAELGLEESVLLWNVVPTHPGTATSNRPPRAAEIEGGLPFARHLARGGRSSPSAAARRPRSALRTCATRATAARRNSGPGCYDSAPADGEFAAFYAKDLERKAGRGRAPLVPRRRRREDPRASRYADRGHAPREAQG